MGSAEVTVPPPPEFLRLYYLTTAQHALSNIALQRIKVARFSDMNDPFELLALNVLDAGVRRVAKDHRRDQDAQEGLVCFSEDWTSPVMWSHYADKHRGVCLGFDVRRDLVHKVSYVDERIRAESGSAERLSQLPEGLARNLRATKCQEWSYEREWRLFVRLEDAIPVGGVLFRRLDADLRLAEVVLGPRCVERHEDVRGVVARAGSHAITISSRLASGHFKVVPRYSSVT